MRKQHCVCVALKWAMAPGGQGLSLTLRAAPHAAGRTPLHAAAAAGQVASVEELVRQGAAVDARDLTAQLTPLHVAAEYGYGAVAAKLLELGAALEATTDQGHTPLSLAVSKVGYLPMLLTLASSCLLSACLPVTSGVRSSFLDRTVSLPLPSCLPARSCSGTAACCNTQHCKTLNNC